jgi:hypothetical protein
VGPITMAEGVRPEMSSPAQTLGSRIRIPLEARMSVRVYSVSAVLCRQRPCYRADPPPKESYELSIQEFQINSDDKEGTIREGRIKRNMTEKGK